MLGYAYVWIAVILNHSKRSPIDLIRNDVYVCGYTQRNFSEMTEIKLWVAGDAMIENKIWPVNIANISD